MQYNPWADVVLIIIPLLVLVVVGLIRNELRYRRQQHNACMYLTPDEWDEWDEELTQ